MRTRYLLSAAALLIAPMTLAPVQEARAQIGIGFNITVAPPELPIYEPPPLPGPGYIFTPGYWDYAETGYYWVPGTWVEPPSVGLLWTPGYWGFLGGVYRWNGGYWGPHVGFYGGVNYGFGYTGAGFFGGEWRGGAFAYNEAAFGGARFFGGGVHVNTFNRTIVNNTTINRVSFNGPGGIAARPSAEEARFASERHIPATSAQLQNRTAAASRPELRASANHGAPAVAAVQHPGQFSGPGVVRANAAETRANASETRANASETRANASETRANAEQTRANTAAERQPAHTARPSTAGEPARTSAERTTPHAPVSHQPALRGPVAHAAPVRSPVARPAGGPGFAPRPAGGPGMARPAGHPAPAGGHPGGGHSEGPHHG